MIKEQDQATKKVSLPIGEEIQQLFGRKDEVRKLIEEALQVKLVARDGLVSIQGQAEDVAVGEQVVSELISQLTRGERVAPQDVKLALRLFMKKEEEEFKRIQGELIEVSSKKRPVRPKGPGQRWYIEAIRHHDIVFAIGPAGTGKTYLAMAMAVSALLKHEVNRIILTRPAVEAGERLGFLPGTLSEKINPYLRPLYDALYEMLDGEKVARFMERGTIEVAPLAYMRGRTLNDSFIILDEAQNTTPEQMKMFLTRLGFGSKVVVTGDVTQIDLPEGRGRSGLMVVRDILTGIDGLAFVELGSRDVVRHRIVQDIVDAYGANERPEGRRPASSFRDGP